MSLSVHKPHKELNEDFTKTYLGQGNGFKIKIYENSYYKSNKDKWLANSNAFKGISNKEVSLTFSTSWDLTGGAKLANKVRDNLLSNKILRGLASQNRTGNQTGIDPFILSDAWTQKKMTGSSPITVNLSFRSFYESNINATSYTTVIPFLTQICSPPGGLLKLGDSASTLLKAAGQGFVDTLANFTDAAKTIGSSILNSNDKNGDVIDNVVSGVNTLVDGVSKFVDDQAMDTAGAGINNGNFTVLLSLGDVIHERSLSNKDSVKKLNTKIDWIITSYSAKPSTNFIMVEDLPMPLWFDIDVTLESRLNLSNRFIFNILNNKEINFNPG